MTTTEITTAGNRAWTVKIARSGRGPDEFNVQLSPALPDGGVDTMASQYGTVTLSGFPEDSALWWLNAGANTPLSTPSWEASDSVTDQLNTAFAAIEREVGEWGWISWSSRQRKRNVETGNIHRRLADIRP